MEIMPEKIAKLKEYFAQEQEIVLAFLFGSRGKGSKRAFSDWDIAVYFRPYQYAELETKKEYPQEHVVWREVENILQSEADLLVLNRAAASLVFSVLDSGVALSIKDRKLYLKLLLRTHYEAVDYWNFSQEFYQIFERARSICEEDKAVLRQHLVFLEIEFGDLEKFKNLNFKEYKEDRDKRRNIERWVENLVMSAIDIAKIVLASEKSRIPQTYRETLLCLSLKFMEEAQAQEFSQFAEMRNIIAHEYLDIKWERIKGFLGVSERLCPVFIREVKGLLHPPAHLPV